jgi:hypothetical protein
MSTSEAKRFMELEKENARLKKLLAEKELDYRYSQGGEQESLLSPAQRRRAVMHVQKTLRLFERWACRVLENPVPDSAISLRRPGGTLLSRRGWSPSPMRTFATATAGGRRC